MTMPFINAADVIANFSLLTPGSRKSIFRPGDLLRDETAGSAADVQKQAAARFTNKVEARNDRLLRQRSEDVVEGGRVTNPNFGSQQLASFQIPTMIRA